MKPILCTALVALTPLVLAQPIPPAAVCITMQATAAGKVYPIPLGTDSTEKLSRLGYRLSSCDSAQMKVTLEVRLTGESEETARVRITAEGTNGLRTGRHQTEMSAKEYEQAPTVNTGAALVAVFNKIDPQYEKRVLDAPVVPREAPPSASSGRKGICTSFRIFASGKEVALPEEMNHLDDEFFGTVGLQPTSCDKAQIRIGSEMRFAQAQTDSPILIKLSIVGRSGQRTETYQMEFTGDEWRNEQDDVLARAGLGIVVVLDKIEPGFVARYADWVRKRLRAPAR